MKRVLLLAICPIFIAGCNIKQSICVDDQRRLMNEVYIVNCKGRFDLTYENQNNWVSQDLIPSKCDFTQVFAVDHNGKINSFRQYKNDIFQAALSAEVSLNENTSNPILENLYLSRKMKNETCAKQINRHRLKRNELLKEEGSIH